MKASKTGVLVFGMVAVATLLSVTPVSADRWDVRREIAEGNREIRRERREAYRQILDAGSPWEMRREIREAGREVRREEREQRREVRREARQWYWGWD